MPLFYQSNQSGIETAVWKHGVCSQFSINRTKAELKLLPDSFEIEIINFYQSNQSGIETYYVVSNYQILGVLSIEPKRN